MRRALDPTMERARHVIPGYEPGSGTQGAFKIAPFGDQLRIVASDGRDWDEAGLPRPAWEHVSVSLERRTPTWKEMEWVRDQFWEPEECVMQLSVPRAQHINHHPYCLHLWRPVGVDIPLPPSITVAPTTARVGQPGG